MRMILDKRPLTLSVLNVVVALAVASILVALSVSRAPGSVKTTEMGGDVAANDNVARLYIGTPAASDVLSDHRQIANFHLSKKHKAAKRKKRRKKRERRAKKRKRGEKGNSKSGQASKKRRKERKTVRSRKRTPRRVVRKLDKNGDGKVSRSEWTKSSRKFSAIDANNDGYLTASEFASHWSRGRKKAAPIDLAAQEKALLLSLRQATRVTSGFEGQPIAALPPTVDDVTKILEEQGLADPKLAEQRQQAARRSPPAHATREQLISFYKERGLAAGKIGNSDLELADFTKAVQLAEAEHSTKLPELLMALSRAERKHGRRRKNIRLIERALRHTGRKKKGQRIRYMSALVRAYAGAGMLMKAEKTIAAVERLLGHTKDRASYDQWKYKWLPRAMRAKAQLLEIKGQSKKAENLYRSAIELTEKGSSESDISRYGEFRDFTRSDLAWNLLKQGRVVEAEIEIRRSLLDVLARVGRYSTETPAVLLRFVYILRQQGRLKEASQLAKAAIDIMEHVGMETTSVRMVAAKRALAKAYIQSGQLDAGLALYDELVVLLKEHPNVFDRQLLGDTDWMLALILVGRHDEVLPIVRRALAKKRFKVKTRRRLRIGILAMALARKGEIEAALNHFRSAVPSLIAAVEEDDDEEYTSGTALEFQITTILEDYIEFLSNLGGPSMADARKHEAVAEAFRIADAVRGRSTRRALSASLVRTKIEDRKLADLARSEQDTRKRITTQSAVLTGILSEPLDEQDPKTVETLRNQIQALHAAHTALIQEITRKLPNYAELIRPEPPTPLKLRVALQDGEAFVSIYLGRNRSFVWAVPKDGDVAFATVDLTRKRAVKIVRALREALNPQAETLGDIPDFDLRLAYRLFRQLLAPVEIAWRPAKSLIVSANGALGQLPFSILPTAKSRLSDAEGPLFSSYRKVPWLARTHSVTFVPSASSFITLRSARGGRIAGKPFIGFGDPIFNEEHARVALGAAKDAWSTKDSTGTLLATRGLPIRLRSSPRKTNALEPALSMLPRLPDTAKEVESLAATMSAAPATSVFLRLQATESLAKSLDLSAFKVIAFATHGLVPGEIPGLREPALALSAPSVSNTDGDGLLTMTEIMGLKLNADWVVLSACNTGTGRGAGAEAVSGLGRAFFYAGTRSLLVSSWPVETVSARLMTTDLFRRQIEDNQLDRAEALRQAMLALLDRPGKVDENTGHPLFFYSHPIFWAPFVLVGDGGRRTSSQ